QRRRLRDRCRGAAAPRVADVRAVAQAAIGVVRHRGRRRPRRSPRRADGGDRCRGRAGGARRDAVRRLRAEDGHCRLRRWRAQPGRADRIARRRAHTDRRADRRRRRRRRRLARAAPRRAAQALTTAEATTMARSPSPPERVLLPTLVTPTLTKAELAELLFERLGLNKRESKDMVEAFFDLIYATL